MLEEQVESCRMWAQNQRDIRRIYFYGSRVWGAPRTNSDLDIMVVAEVGASVDSEKWRQKLTGVLGFDVHIANHWDAKPKIMRKVKREGILIFSRWGDERNFEFDDHPI